MLHWARVHSLAMQLFGIDFTSAPGPRKAITIAVGHIDDGTKPSEHRVALQEIIRIECLPAFANWLQAPGPWLAGCDFPFGLPRELLDSLDWPRQDWPAMIQHLSTISRAQMVAQFRAFCAARPVGRKFAHRAADGPAGSSPSMKWVNPPVAFMLHAGAPCLLRAGVHLPGLHDGDSSRIALEAYPGLLARKIIGRASYKSDNKLQQTPERLARRAALVAALEEGSHDLQWRCALSEPWRQRCIDDASGDDLDAVLCLVQAAWAWQRRNTNYGLPADLDPLEGWIVSAGR